MDIEKAIGAYIQLRDRITIRKQEHKAEITELEETQLKIANLMDLALKQTVGEDASITTPVGTVFRAKKDSVRVANKAEFSKFLLSEIERDGVDALSLIKLSANKNAIKEFMDDNEDDLPPGIKYEQWLEIQVRRSNK